MAADPPISTLLRDRIAERMAELGLSPTDLEQATGLSGVGLANVRKGQRRRYQVRLTRPLTEALRWTPDSIERLLDGKEPRPIGQGTTEPTIADLDRKIDELRELVHQLVGKRHRREVGDGGTPTSMPRPVLRGRNPR